MATIHPTVSAGYETTFITRTELSEENLKALQDRLAEVITTFQGEVVLKEDWGRRKLAYPIKKETRGQYTYLVYAAKGEVVHEIERTLRLQDHVLRFLTVNLGKEFEATKFAKQRSDLQAAAKRREEEREARREEKNMERRAQNEERSHYRRNEVEESDDMSGDLTDSE